MGPPYSSCYQVGELAQTQAAFPLLKPPENDLLPKINLINSVHLQFGVFVLISIYSVIPEAPPHSSAPVWLPAAALLGGKPRGGAANPSSFRSIFSPVAGATHGVWKVWREESPARSFPTGNGSQRKAFWTVPYGLPGGAPASSGVRKRCETVCVAPPPPLKLPPVRRVLGW